MGRTKGSINRKFATRFKDYEGAFPKDRHIRLTYNMLTSESCISLSPNAFRLYCYMKLIACGNQEFEFATSCAVGKDKIFQSKSTYVKARNELIEKGFIDYTNMTSAKYKKEVGKYMFLTKWRNNK